MHAYSGDVPASYVSRPHSDDIGITSLLLRIDRLYVCVDSIKPLLISLFPSFSLFSSSPYSRNFKLEQFDNMPTSEKTAETAKQTSDAYNDPGADVFLCSEDNVLFRVHSYVLKASG